MNNTDRQRVLDQVVLAASQQLAEGKLSNEEFDKLLNTTAKFFERMQQLD